MALDIQRISGTTAKVAARLCNFATAHADLLPEHVEFLDKEIAPVIRGMQGPWVDLLGYASRRGDAAFNLALSERRINAVKHRISTYAHNVNFQIQKGLGETESGPNESNNDGYWRAVEVYVYGHKPPPPKPPAHASSTSFEIRVVGGVSISLGGQSDNFFFQIVDLGQQLTAFYHYTGLAIPIVIPHIPGPGTMTKSGPPTRFRTNRSATLDEFNSKAELYQDPGMTLGSWSAGGTIRLSINHIVDATGMIFTRPGIIPIAGGWGIAMPSLGSAGYGVLSKVTPNWPFTGY
jgi:hypothetical protein